MRHLLRFDSPVYNLQVFLRTISRKYSEIPDVIPDGVYGDATQKAVTAFQNKFNLNPDGITDFSTWNHIVRVYKDIEEENNMLSVRIYPEAGLNESDASFTATMFAVQSMLYALSEVFSNIPAVDINGISDEKTINAIKSVQIASGLNPDGKITPTFWNYLVSIYEAHISRNRVDNFSGNITE